MKIFLTLALTLALGSMEVFGQATAQIHGTVQDMSGAAISGANVKATQAETGLARTTISDADGNYVITNLPLGPYSIAVSKEGFSTALQSGIVLQVNSDPAVPVTLKLGNVSEQIEVQANTTQVETSQVGVGSVIESQRILDLPLNGRQPTDLITLSGVAVQTGSSPAYGMRAGVSIAVAGGTSYSVQYNLDGAFHVEVWSGTNLPLPFPDSLQEFKLVTSTQDASSGGHSSASVNAVTKSGTNAFHGDAFEFFRNSDLNGRDFFASTSDQLKRNQFGGVLGGPVKKDKVFFFVGYQGTLTRQSANSSIAFIPTPKMQTGDFSDYMANNCPEAGGLRASGVLNSQNHLTIPLSPAAVAISKVFQQSTNPCGRVFFGNPVKENDLQVPVRLDYQINGKQSLFGRYLATRIDAAVPWSISHDPLSVGVGNDDMAQSLTLGHTYLITPSVINSFRLFGNRIGSNHRTPQWGGPQDFGIKNFYSYIPTFVPILLNGDASVGFGPNFTSGTTGATSFGFNDDVTIVHGNHQLAFGANLTHAILVNNSYAWSEGTFVFVPAPPTLSTLANFLTGSFVQLHQANPNPQYLNQNYFSLYAGDVWKVTPKFTLNYGVRWNPFYPAVFRQSDVSSFSLANFYAGTHSTVIPSAPPGFIYPGDPGFNGRSSQPVNLNHLEPRIGFAYDPFGDGKTAIRGGAGIAYDFARMDVNINAATNAPFRQTVIVNGGSLDNPYANVPGGNPFPYFYNPKNPVFPTFPQFQSYIIVPPNLQTPEQYAWNLGIQRQLSPSLFISATYLGSHLIHGPNAIELNPGQYIPGNCVAGQYGLTAPGPCSNANNVDFRRKLYLSNPGNTENLISSLTQTDDGNTQRYNGLLLNATWRKGGLNLSGNYTWSHCTGPAMMASTVNIGNGNPHEAGQNAGPTDRRFDYGNCASTSTQDVRHLANVTAIYAMPKISGGNGFVNQLGSGWTLSTIYTVRSGSPLAIATGVDQALNGIYTSAGQLPSPQRPNQVLPDVAATNRGQSCSPAPCISYLNQAAFAMPAPGTYGNLGFGSVYGPGFWEWDQTVSRRFHITEKQNVELRAEAFNVTNSVRLANPGLLFNSPATFGKITTSASTTGSVSPTGSGGRIIQFALKYIF